MLSSGGFTVTCLQALTKGVLDPRLPWAERVLLGLRQPRRPSPHIEDGQGSVAPRSVTDSTDQWV
jgi:hypothetical protein